jgi:CheY-like chemotaxis protein
MCTREKMTKKVRKTFDWRGYTILVAEDVDINFVLISEILKYTGVNVIRARDGQECVDLYDVNKNLVDLILLDIQMPILNGYETMRIIKKINKNIPIIVQTAYAMNDDIKKSYDAGCDDYITKPMTRDNLLNKINNLMYNKN